MTQSNRHSPERLVFLLLAAFTVWLVRAGEPAVQPPAAAKIPKALTMHGHTRTDSYFWLNERENPKVIEYLQAENAYTDAIMKPAEALQEKLYQEMTGRIEQDDQSVPVKKLGYVYFTRFEKGREYPLYCRKKGSAAGREEILLDVNALAAGHSYYQAANLQVASNNRLLAFGEDTVSRRQYVIRFKDLATGEMLPDRITNTSGNLIWAEDNRTIFYTVKDAALRPYLVKRHILGQPVENDPVVYEEKDETFRVGVGLARSRQYILIGSYSTLTTEYRLIPARQPGAAPVVFHPRERGLEYQLEHLKNLFYIRTNWEAPNFRLMTAKPGRTEKSGWKELIPHRAQVLLQEFELFNDYLVLGERKNGFAGIRVRSLDGGMDYDIPPAEAVYVLSPDDNPDPATVQFRYSYTSPVTPETIYEFNMKTKAQVLLKRKKVPGGYDPAAYAVERLQAPARDGVPVPVSMVYRRGMERNGKNPLLLYGYGSYGASTDPYFNSPVISLLDRGFIFAIAHIRGGEEMGRFWYEDGKLLKKKNTFTDFIDCAEYLTSKHYTSAEHLYARGGSAGGLLMGAVVNLRPDLFKGVVANVPFVDVVTTMLDSSIPLTTGEYDEWGNPAQKEYYDYMLSYSPYDNVEPKQYPALLVTTGLHDSQVQYWEPAKWVARLREMKTGDSLLLLKTNMEAGHGGASGRFRRLRETAFDYTFLLMLEGIRE